MGPHLTAALTPKPLALSPSPCCHSRWGQAMEYLKRKKERNSLRKLRAIGKYPISLTDPLKGSDILRCMAYVT